jgi:pimeloyl-ACP methyl ester carboxylesterase
VRYAQHQVETFPKARVVMLPESGHFPFADDPQAVIEAVVPFFRERFSGDPAGFRSRSV